MAKDNSALFRHTRKVYELMEERSTINEYEERIFEGSLTNLAREVGASSSYYSAIRTLLDSPHHDPCIILYQRGSGSHLSIIRLMHPPPEEWGTIAPVDLTSPGVPATLRELESRVAELEAWRESTVLDKEGRAGESAGQTKDRQERGNGNGKTKKA